MGTHTLTHKTVLCVLSTTTSSKHLPRKYTTSCHFNEADLIKTMLQRPNVAFLASFCLLLTLRCSPTSSSTHWVVTEDGKIQSQVNSIFHMKRPFDLVSFLQQERRVEQLENLKEILADTSSLDKVVDKHEPDLESRFYDKDSDCQKAGQPLTEFDLFVSTLIHPDATVIPEVSSILRDDFVHSDSYEQPICDLAKPKFFELEVIDDLSSTVRKDVLTMPPEVGLLSNVLEHNRFSLAQYGQLVYESIKSEKVHNWLATLLASNFWRILGKPKEAIDCLRKSIYSAPVNYKHLGLLSLANVFHRTHNSQDAITTLDLALKYAPENPAIFFTMGNVHATLMQFNNSAQSYADALKIQPQFDAAKSRRHAVLCHHKLEQALEEQHRSLEATLNELRQYKRQHDEWSALLNKILAEQASLEARIESRMGYEEFRMRQSKTGKGQNCFQHTNMGRTMVTCSLVSDNDIHKDLWTPTAIAKVNEEKSKNVETLIQKFQHTGSNEESLNSEEKSSEPSLPPKYSKWPDQKAILPFDDSDWPLSIDCTSQVSKLPKWNEYPSVFFSPENKGFDVAKMMSEGIGIPLEFPAPLPWLPPTCKPFTGKTKYDNLKLLDN